MFFIIGSNYWLQFSLLTANNNENILITGMVPIFLPGIPDLSQLDPRLIQLLALQRLQQLLSGNPRHNQNPQLSANSGHTPETDMYRADSKVLGTEVKVQRNEVKVQRNELKVDRPPETILHRQEADDRALTLNGWVPPPTLGPLLPLKLQNTSMKGTGLIRLTTTTALALIWSHPQKECS